MMKKIIFGLVTLSLLMGSCNTVVEPSEEDTEIISTHAKSPVPTTTETLSPTITPTVIPTPESHIKQTASEDITQVSLGGMEISIRIILQPELAVDYLEINAVDTKDYIFLEIVDPNQVYLPYIELIPKNSLETLSIEVRMPPKELYAVSYGPYEVIPEDLDMELFTRTSLVELPALMNKLEEAGSITMLFPQKGEKLINEQLDVYKVSYLESVFLVLPSNSTSRSGGGMASRSVPLPLFIVFTFLVLNGDEILNDIKNMYYSVFDIDKMEVKPGVTYEEWMNMEHLPIGYVLPTVDIPLPIEIQAAHEKIGYASSNQAIYLYFTWYAKTAKQVNNFINNVNITIHLNGKSYSGYFGSVSKHDSCSASGQVVSPCAKSEWEALLPGLPPGTYTIEITWELASSVSDGIGTVGPGVFYTNSITLYVD